MAIVTYSNMECTYIDHMGSDNSVVNAARVSFAKTAEKYSEVQNEKLIKYLAEHNHITPFMHASLTFHLKAPIFIARQFMKHQVGLAWNEVSRRYVDDTPEFFAIPPLRERAPNKKQGSLDTLIDRGCYVKDIFSQATSKALEAYQEALKQGVCPEQARMILPQSMMTEWYWTGSLMAFCRVCNLRLESHAQKEAQMLAEKIYQVLVEKFPLSTKYLIKI